jgi:hypothetical protein
MTQPIGKSPSSLPAIRTRFASGGAALPNAASMVWKTCRVRVLQGLFPPEQRYRVVILATEKPADHGIPAEQWSLSDLAARIVNEAHADKTGVS